MLTIQIKINQDQTVALEKVLKRNPGWNKTLVMRALLNYFLKLDAKEQVDLVKKHYDLTSE